MVFNFIFFNRIKYYIKSKYDFFHLISARRIVFFFLDVRDVPVQVRQLHAERVRRRIRSQPHSHEFGKVIFYFILFFINQTPF